MSATIQIASLTEFFEDYTLDQDRELLIQWTGPKNQAVRLRATGLKPRVYYRMDTLRPSGDSSYRWPADILSALRLLRSDIGLVGLVRMPVAGAQREVYLPLRVSTRQEPLPRGSHRVVLLSSVELAEVYLTLVSVGPGAALGAILLDGKPLGYGYYPAGRTVEIDLPHVTKSGLYRLEIGATLRGGGADSVSLWFSHSP